MTLCVNSDLFYLFIIYPCLACFCMLPREEKKILEYEFGGFYDTHVVNFVSKVFFFIHLIFLKFNGLDL